MSKKNDDFFEKKKAWSVVKDELLGCYLKPYVSKILNTYKPLLYVDCFAGKGKFDDGNDGSPLIALKIIDECLLRSNATPKPKVQTFLIDLNYADDLRKNTDDYSHVDVISGRFEDLIVNLLQSHKGENVFLYIDPYGIKALQSSRFKEFANMNFNSVELLINMNSFGFIRAACRALGTTFKEESSFFDDLVEYDPGTFTQSSQSINDLNDIAGGDYWQEIIWKYNRGEITGYEAEEEFARLYCENLKKSYRYVLNMPIRIRKGQHPKYRMIHVTNHPDGCLIMVDDMCQRWELLNILREDGQLSLWQNDIDGFSINENELEEMVVMHYSQYKKWTPLNESLAEFFSQNGVVCNTKDVKRILTKLEDKNRLSIKRDPEFTDKKKPSKFLTETKKKKVYIKWSV